MNGGDGSVQRPFVVTGCPRSGTHFLSDVLSRAGLNCRHEAVFGPAMRAFTGFGAADGDSSWLAVPFLQQLPAEVVVLHQTRHPLDVVRSLLGIRFLDDVPPWRERMETARAAARWQARTVLAGPLRLPASELGPRPLSAFRQFLREHAPEVYAEPTPAERALRMWVVWNQRAAAVDTRSGYLRYRVEDLDAALLQELLALIGRPTPIQDADRALQTASRDGNSRRRAVVDWDDLPAGPARRAADSLATAYGYRTTRTLLP